MSVDYTRIEKTDEIKNIGQQGVVDNEAVLAGRVTRGNPAADPLGVGIISAVDATLVNVSHARLEAYDAAIDYNLETSRWGVIALFAAGTWTTHYKQQVQPLQPPTENVGLSYVNPLKFKANAGLNWDIGRWSAGWNTRYFSHYQVSSTASIQQSQGGDGEVPSQMYHDVYVGYAFPGSEGSLLSGVRLQSGVKNVFNKRPPVDAFSSFGYYSPFGDPRLATYYCSIRKQF